MKSPDRPLKGAFCILAGIVSAMSFAVSPEDYAGMSAVPGSMRPSASAMICMVLAVPMKEQAPQEGQACCLYQVSCSSVISPRAHLAE